MSQAQILLHGITVLSNELEQWYQKVKNQNYISKVLWIRPTEKMSPLSHAVKSTSGNQWDKW